jgi:flagellar biosynthesis protein FlhA
MKAQLFSNPRVLGTVSATVFLFALMPGMPAIPFIIFGLVLGTSSYMVRKGKKEVLALIPEENAAAEPSDEKVEQYLQVDPIEIEIGYGLISLVDEKSGGNLFHKISSTRKFIALEYGILIPPVRVRDNLQLNPNEYIIKIKGNIAALYEIYPDRFLAMNSVLTKEKLEGIPTKDPAFDMPAYWIAQNEKDRAELLEYTVVDCTSVLSTHLQETLKKNFDKILTRQAVRQLLENLKKEYPAVIEDINPDILPIGSIQKVLQNLLKEFIPVKDLVQILESLIDYSKVTKNIDVLTEYVRHAIGDTISNLFKDHNGIIHAAILDENIESIITRSLQNQKDSSLNLGLSGTVLRKLNGNIQLSIQKFKNLGYIPVIITSATIRPYFYRLINSSFTEVAVLSYSELPSNIEIEFIDKIEVTIAN